MITKKSWQWDWLFQWFLAMVAKLEMDAGTGHPQHLLSTVSFVSWQAGKSCISCSHNDRPPSARQCISCFENDGPSARQAGISCISCLDSDGPSARQAGISGISCLEVDGSSAKQACILFGSLESDRSFLLFFRFFGLKQ